MLPQARQKKLFSKNIGVIPSSPGWNSPNIFCAS